MIKKEELEVLLKETTKGIKSEQDLSEFRRMLTKITVKATLNAEWDVHL